MGANWRVLVLVLAVAGGCVFTGSKAVTTAGRERPTATAEELLAEGDRLFRARKYAEALPVYERAAAAVSRPSRNTIAVEALAQVARMYSLTERLDEGRVWLEKARERATPDEPLGWTRYLGVRGIFEREDGEKATALATFIEMYDYALEHDFPARAIDAAHHAAIVAPQDEQIAWAEKGIAAAEAGGQEGWLAVLWNNLGATYDYELKDYEQAIRCYEKARYYHYRTGSEQQKLAADWALGKAYLQSWRLAEAEPILTECYKRAKARYEQEPNKDTLEWLGYCEQWYGELFAYGGYPATGLPHLRQARVHLVEAGIERWWPEGLEQLDARIAEVGAAVR